MTIALSWSRLSDYNQCALKFKMKYLDKMPMFKMDDQNSPHLVRGNNVHKALESYVVQKNAGNDVPVTSLQEVESTKPFIDRYLSSYAMVMPETQIAVDKDWKQVEWFASDAYYRVIYDLIAINPTHVAVVDYKAGKMRDYDGGPNGFGQLHLAGGIALHLWPNIERVDSVYAYVDHKQTVPKVFTRDDSTRLREHFDAESLKVNSDKEFKPTINEFCKWCPVTRKHCPYSRKI